MEPTAHRSLLLAVAVLPIALLFVLGGTNVVALDDDGVPAAAELAAGTDPFAADTDGDELDDAAERRAGTDPTTADTDGDGLDDATEVAGTTHPTDPDADGDGLSDGREVALGTHPLVPDTDGDGLLDGAEADGHTSDGVPLPGANPRRMTLYVAFSRAGDAAGIAPDTVEHVEAHFAGMPVENPDGSTGIDLRTRRGDEIEGPGTYTGDNFDALETAAERDRGTGEGHRHGVLLVPFDPGVSSVGFGDTPGDFVVVDADTTAADRESIVVHELLHTVTGELEQSPGRCPDDPAHYCDGGWLEPSLGGDFDRSLPEPIASELEENGFED